MAVLTIKNLPDSIYDRLKRRAAARNRSLNREAVAALEESLAMPAEEDVEQFLRAIARARGDAASGKPLRVAELDAARQRGRE